MILELAKGDFHESSVDRDGVLNANGRQGFFIYLMNGMTIHAEDENDVVNLAQKILLRLGEAK